VLSTFANAETRLVFLTLPRDRSKGGAADDCGVVHPAAILALACACLGTLWLLLAGLTLANRAAYDRRRVAAGRRFPAAPGSRRERRLLRRAASHRTGAGRWRRVATLQALADGRHPEARALLERALVDPDRDIVGAAVKALGRLGDEWAAAALIGALREDLYPRSRIAAQLERLAPKVGHLLVPLLADAQAPVRFWAATLLARYPGLALDELTACAHDSDANVRAAALAALGASGDSLALPTALQLLDDPAWFVRAHACRAVGALGSPAAAADIASLLADDWWWVRAAAKDALRSLGSPAAPAVVPYLEHADRFARNSAAEVLQDVGFVDALAARDPHGDLLARIYAAGGRRLRAAAERRVEAVPTPDEQAA
jgi:HEAT repeat protein